MKRLRCASRDRLLPLIFSGGAAFVRLGNPDNLFFDLLMQFGGKPPGIVAIPLEQWRASCKYSGHWTRWNPKSESSSIPFTNFAVVPTRWKP